MHRRLPSDGLLSDELLSGGLLSGGLPSRRLPEWAPLAARMNPFALFFNMFTRIDAFRSPFVFHQPAI